MTDEMNWFLLQTKSRQEQRATEHLNRQSVTSFCPMIKVEKISRSRRVESLEVLFPGYLFVQLGETSVSPTSICSTRGVSHFVTTAGAPIKVPESLVDQLRERVAVNTDVVASSLPKVGEEMEIIEGPFRGLNAAFSQTDGKSRALVLITMLNQQVRASLPFSSLSPLNPSQD